MGHHVQDFSQLNAKVLVAASLKYVIQKRFEEGCMFPYQSPSAYMSTVSAFLLPETVHFRRSIPQVSFLFTGWLVNVIEMVLLIPF